MREPFIRIAGAILCALALSGCVDSSGPLLSDAQPVLGEQLRLQFYSLRKGTADEPEQATYKWDRGAYQRTGGGMTDIGSFSVHPLARDIFVVQSAAAKRPGTFEYVVARRLVDGGLGHEARIEPRRVVAAPGEARDCEDSRHHPR